MSSNATTPHDPLSGAQTELASYLADFTLATDTAAGALALQKLAEEHHCGATLTVEPYEGLRKVGHRYVLRHTVSLYCC